jgi:proteasome alpha subunit
MIGDDHGEERYDLAIDIFSPDGRMYQVEYAREAVKKGSLGVGIIYNDGILLIAEKRIPSKLIEREYYDKVFQLDKNIGCTASGLIADARVLVKYARHESQRFRLRYGERISIRDLAMELSNLKQVYTQYGGTRPFGTSLIIGGFDSSGKHLFETDPSGALKEYSAGCIGAGRELATSFIDALYEDGMDLKEAISFGLGAIYKGTEGKVNFMSMEIVTITKQEGFQKLDFDTFKTFIEEIVRDLKKARMEEEDKEEDN